MPGSRERIGSYRFGKIEIDGRDFRSDVIITGHGVLSDWLRKKGHRLDVDDLAHVPLDTVTHIIVGTGYYGMMKVSPALEEYCERHGIQLESMRTARAVERFNACTPGKTLIGAFHLTC